jgi:UDP-N-acetylglucosamine--N-acetylmuramyl-(pentapeptide) pyrophosphoryl-undecaprenol N-acetylglucosamine transferase
MSTIVLSAGGTGGHLFPAQALAGELLRRGRRIVVMTDSRGRNYQSVFPGASIEQVPSATFVGSLLSRTLAPVRILAGIVVSFFKLRRIKPSAVVGFGGYPSLPVLAAALMDGVPTAIHEQNAVLGRVNRQFADRVKAVAASLPVARFAPKNASRIVYTGNPVRPEAVNLAGAPYTTPRDGETIRLLVFGGSQGARALSELVPAAIASLPQGMRSRLNIVQQCRPEDLDEVRTAYEAAGIAAELAAFFDDMPARIAASHLVIARSGASTVSELTVIGRPAILIPFPFATDDHQTANAAVLANAGAAWLLPQRDLSVSSLTGLLEKILQSPDELERHARAALSLAKPDAASRLADVVEKIAGREAA